MIVPKPLRTEHPLLESLILDPQEVNRHDPEKIRLLSEDMRANGQLQPGGCTERGEVIFGTGRVLALRLIGTKTAEMKIYPDSITPTQRTLIRSSENLHRQDYTGFQKFQICAKLLEENPTWRQKDLVDALHVSESMICHLLSPSKCTEEWLDALRELKVTIADCYKASKLPREQQNGLLALKLSGASPDQLQQHARKARNGHTEVGKAKSMRCLHPSGLVIQFKGEEVTLESALDALSDLSKELRKGIEQNYSPKTMESVLKSKAEKKA